jgi:hypothetical protein
MRSASIGEWLLCLVMSRDRAMGAVGDLMEEGSERSAFWFWWCVARTMLWLLGRELMADPLGMLGLALRGILAELGLLLMFFAACLVVIGVFFIALPHVLPGSLELGGVALWAIGTIFGLWIPFVAGRMVARLSRGRELAACFALAILQTVLAQIASLKWPALSWPDNGLRGWLWAILVFPFLNIPLWAAAGLERRRSL